MVSCLAIGWCCAFATVSMFDKKFGAALFQFLLAAINVPFALNSAGLLP